MPNVGILSRDLNALGLRRGDHVLVRAAMKAIGPTQEPVGKVLINTLLSTVGDQGTIVGLAFTDSFCPVRTRPQHVFDLDMPPITGGFAKAMLAWPGAYRSSHPTNSFVGIGRLAEFMLEDHDHTKSCFHPLRKLIDQRGKLLLIGCVESSPGLSTLHLAQDDLGLSRRKFARTGTMYRDGNEVRIFVRADEPGCSMGFWKAYANYVRAGILLAGYVGSAYSLIADAKSAYEIDFEALKTDPRFPLCDNPYCFRCRANLTYNLRDATKYYFRNPRRLVQVIRSWR